MPAHKVHDLLDLAEKAWRETIRTELPLFMDMKVEKAEPDPKNPRHWRFYTDNKVIHMDVFKPDIVLKAFQDKIKSMYKDAYGEALADDELVNRLIHDNFFYLHFHELFHPARSPDSQDDEKKIDKSLFDGISEAEKHTSKPDAIRKVGNVRNAVWDQIVDSSFYGLSSNGGSLERRIEKVLGEAKIDAARINKMPDGVIPIFDVIEMETEKEMEIEKGNSKSLYYPITRAMYSLLFTKDAGMRTILFDYFKEKLKKQVSEKDLLNVIGAALKGLTSDLTPEQLRFTGIDKTKFSMDIDGMLANYKDKNFDSLHAEVFEQINTVLVDKKSRYDAIKGFIKPLAKYISIQNEEKRHGTHVNQDGSGSGSASGQGGGSSQGQPNPNQAGGNTEQALLNIAELMGAGEASDLLAQIANSSCGSQGGKAAKEKRLINLAKDEYYKKNVKEILMRTPEYESVQLDLGKKRISVYVGTQILTPQEVVNLPFEKILKFQEETNITQLFKLSEDQYRFDEYEWQETQDTDYTFQNTGIDLPDNIVIHVDSSGSMGIPAYVGTGREYDTLMHLIYGMFKTLKKKAEEMGKDPQIIVANFSNGTILSKPSTLIKLYNSPNDETKQVLTGFQNGGTEYSPGSFKDIKKMLKPGKTVHIWVSDGGLEYNCEPNVLQQVTEAVKDPNTSFLYFGIQCSSSFGNSIDGLSKTHDNVKCFQNVTIQTIQDKSLEVLIQYSSDAK